MPMDPRSVICMSEEAVQRLKTIAKEQNWPEPTLERDGPDVILTFDTEQQADIAWDICNAEGEHQR